MNFGRQWCTCHMQQICTCWFNLDLNLFQNLQSPRSGCFKTFCNSTWVKTLTTNKKLLIKHKWSHTLAIMCLFRRTFNTRFSQPWLWRTLSSGMWGCVDLVWTDILEERITSIFRAEKSASEEAAGAGGCRPWRWRRYVPPTSRFTLDLHSATSQKTAFFNISVVYFTAVSASRLRRIEW
jgi:hypothetical protein